jgi:hypothetical protein
MVTVPGLALLWQARRRFGAAAAVARTLTAAQHET